MASNTPQAVYLDITCNFLKLMLKKNNFVPNNQPTQWPLFQELFQVRLDSPEQNF